MEHPFYIFDSFNCAECGLMLEWEEFENFGSKRMRLHHPKAKCSRSLNYYYAPNVQLTRMEPN